MQKLWETVLQPLCLTVAALAGIVSSWQGILAKNSAAQAEAAALSAKQTLDRDQSHREDVKLERDYEVQVTTMALGSLKDDDPRVQKAMIGLVATLPNTDLGQRLTLALTTSQDAAVRQEAGKSYDEAKTFERQQQVDARARAISQGKEATGNAVGSTDQLTVGPNPKGWDIDIFWCDASDGAARRARTLGDVLARRADNGTRLAGEDLGRVRVRSLPQLVNQRPQYRIFSDIVGPDVSDPTERRFAEAVAQVASQTGVPLTVRPGTSESRWYLSIFYCAA